jgi:oligoendopeptidase F
MRIMLTQQFSAASSAVATKKREEIDDTFKWDLTHIYADEEEWKSAKATLVRQFSQIGKFKGTIHTSPPALYDCLHLVNTLSKELTRLYCYASMRSDEDTRNAKYLGMEQEISQVGSDFAAQTAFIDPEILLMDSVTIERFMAEEPRLEVYRHGLQDTLRRKGHTLSEGEETILANAGLVADSPNSIYGIFSNADFPFPEVTLHDGRKVKLDKANFSLYRTERHRGDRKAVFGEFFGTLNNYRRTFGTQLNAEVRKNLFFARSRRYASCLQRALDPGNIPEEVYRGLIQNVHDHLSVFHRYLALRRRMLGLDTLHYYDLYAPLVEDIDLTFGIREAQEHTLASLAVLGDEYVAIARDGFSSRWLDVYPNEGKRSGAYSNGSVYDVHPYMLLNYNGKYDDMSTLTHELGHTMHSYFSNREQDYANSHYSIFVAEVASTLNEALLMEYMLKSLTEDRQRLSLLGNYLDSIRGTVFRQTQFSEFELRIHEQVERGEPLTGDALNEMYGGICKQYYGHDAGVCVVDEEIAAEWTHIPHFYYNFYVFQYATSFTASSAISERILAGDRETTVKYMELLRSGGRDYPIELLRKAGVDMTTSEPLRLTMQKMARIMDEMEEILGRMKKLK